MIKVFFILNAIFLTLLLSCENIVSNVHKEVDNNISISLGKDVSNTISRTVTSNKNITDNTILQVECSLLRGTDVEVLSEKKDVAIKDLFDVTFKLKNILSGNNYHVSIKFSYNNILIYEAFSSILNLNNNDLNISLDLVQHNSAIKYELNGGEFTAGQRKPVNYFINSNVTIPSPQKSGYAFDGWYLSNEYKEDEKVESLGKNRFLGDITLYAKWSSFSIKFDKIPGEYDFGEKINISCTSPGTKIYYTTDGTDPTENSTLYENSNLTLDKTCTIKAVGISNGIKTPVISSSYTMKTYNIIFNKNGYGTETCNTISNVHKTQEISLPSLTNGDMTFNGWSLGNKVYTSGNIVVDDTMISNAVNKTITFNASWGGIINPLTFSNMTDEADYNENITISTTTPDVKIFYSLDGTEPSLEYKGPITVTSSSKDINTITIKAKATKPLCPNTPVISKTYTIKTYTVNLDTKGKGTLTTNSFILWKGETIPKPSNLNYNGYTLEGWYSSQDFTSGTKWDFAKNTVSASITLYANWTPIVYNITYDMKNTGANNKNTDTTYTIESNEILLKPPVKTGYIGKWISNQVEKTSIPRGSTGDITLTAQLTPISYTVQFALNGGSGNLPKTMNCTYDKDFTLPENNLTKSGFAPDGWSGSDGQAYTSGTMNNLTTTDKAVITMTAKWSDIAPSPVTNANVEKITAPDTPGLKLTWTNPSDADLKKVLITCTEDSSIQKEVTSVTPSGQSEAIISTLSVNNKGTYHFNIFAIDGNTDLSKNKSTPVETVITLPTITQIAIIPDIQPFSKTVSVKVTGSNFNNLTVSDFECVSTNDLAKNLTVNVVNDSNLTIEFYTGIKQSTGTSSDNGTLTLTTFGASATQNFKVRDYAIGDILYDQGTTEAAIIVMNGEESLNHKKRLHRFFGIALDVYKDKVWAMPDTRAQQTRYSDFSRQLNTNSSGIYPFPELNPQGGSDYKGDEIWEQLVTDYTNNGKTEADAENECPAFATAKNHGNKFKDPNLKTGWYLPNFIECSEICYKLKLEDNKNLKELINQKNAATLSETDLYWTSEVPVDEETLNSSNDHEYAWAVPLWTQYTGESITKLKTETAFVQPIIAFD